MNIKHDLIEKYIKQLIAECKISIEQELMDIPLDDLAQFNICYKDLMCYFCYKENNKCIYNCK